ncbi:MAG: peptidoglycan-associated lipoprotein Pal [Candidatus Dadabacteria bacterium]|nr:MAG: peptidoglycan-associated lipoprotein Pal [Candidatus Dadabacteria bacterium]
MRIVKVLMAVILVFGLSACACRTKQVGAGNVPVAAEGSILKDVHFAFDSYALDSLAREILRKNAEWLKAHPDRKVEIEGHCDERGTNEYNMALGAKRARAVKDFLVSLGIAADRMSTVSYGEELPLDPRHNEEAWAKNRRAHFKLL